MCKHDEQAKNLLRTANEMFQKSGNALSAAKHLEYLTAAREAMKAYETVMKLTND